MRIADLNARNGYILYAFENTGQNDISQVFNKMRLKCGLAILVVAEIKEKLVDRLGELPVLRVGIELLTDEFELISNAISVATVAVAQKVMSLVVDLVPLLGRTIL